MTRMLRLIAAVMVLMLVAVACTAGSDDAEAPTAAVEATDSAGGEFAATTVAASDATEREAPEGDLGSGGTGDGVLATVDLGRDIIFTATVTVAVADVAEASRQATAAITSRGGFLFGQQSVGGGEARSTLVFKIDPENFQEALEALGNLGEVRTQNITADDVTEVVVDLESRIATAAASVDRLRDLLENAGDIETIASIESQLLQRETTLESLRGQLRTLQDAVSLATITLTLTEALSNPAMEVQVTAYSGAGEDDEEAIGLSCPGGGGVEVFEGEMVTVCFEIFNTGDTSLTGFTMRDAVLDVEFEDLTLVFGPEDLLEPGQSIVLATELQLDRSLRTQSRWTALPVNDEGQPVEARELVRTTSAFLTARDPGGLPGFSDGLQASWEFLQTLWGLVVVGAGLLVPFLWLIVLALAVRWWRSRNQPAPNESEPADPEPQETVDA